MFLLIIFIFISHTNQQPFGVTNEQRDDAYTRWINAGIAGGLQGIIQYQWGQGNFSAQTGTTISPANTETGQSANPDETGQSPNDGYAVQGVSDTSALDILGQAAQSFGG
ncbi:hypothetical protein ONZ45_g17998 [Pleurotus djamor]|nr:hypothetical protein ONZ45_g17998 [Pleurotus djamor]